MQFAKLTAIMGASLSFFAACKPITTSTEVGVQGQSSQQIQQNIFPSPYDLQEFYDITKEFYFDKLSTMPPELFGTTEKTLMNKFGVRPDSPSQTKVFAETMFELLESGLYEQKLHGIQRSSKLTRSAPKGLSNRDLQDFFQIVKMEYFKKITDRAIPKMTARESGFYERAKSKNSESKTNADDNLLIASDLFDKLEGIK